MKKDVDRKGIALILLVASVIFFGMGFLFPMLESGYGLGPIVLQRDEIYLSSSFRYFFDHGEIFIGLLLLFFTIVFPIIKYLFLFYTLAGKRLPRHHFISTALEIINKWAMLDVFVVAVLILNMKFDSVIIISKLQAGTTLFAIAVLLLMSCSMVAGRLIRQQEQAN